MTVAPKGSHPDVTVVEGPVASALSQPIVCDSMFQASTDQFLAIGGPKSARFLVEGGRCVIFEKNLRVEGHKLARRFITMVIPAVLRQRGLLVLHASSVATEQGVVAIAGDSGAGKSTTVASLVEHGALMVSDDVTALRLGKDGVVAAMPGVAELSLTKTSIARLDVDVAQSSGELSRRMKRAVPTRDRMAHAPAPLTSVFLLTEGDGHEVQIEEQFGRAKFAALSECLYGPVLAHEGPAMFPLIAGVLGQAAVFRVVRPAGVWSVDAVREAVLRCESAPVAS